MSETKGLWNKLLGKDQAPEGSTDDLWRDLVNDNRERVASTPKKKREEKKPDTVGTQGMSREEPRGLTSADETKANEKSRNTSEARESNETSPESTDGMNYMLEYANEKHAARIMALKVVYLTLKDDINQGDEEESESLLNYLGLNKENLTNILIAAFGITNEKADQDFEIWGMVGEAKSLKELLYKQVFGLPENASKTAIQNMVDDMAKQLTLPQLLSFDANKRKKIHDIIAEIMLKERAEERKLTIHEKIGIAKGKGFTKKLSKKIFDSAKLNELIAKIRNDGREMDPEPGQSNASHDTKKPSQTVGTQALVSAKEEENTTIDFAAFYEDSSAEVIEATTRLNALFKRFKDPNTDNSQLAADINKTSVSNGNLLGNKLYSTKFQPVQNMLKLLTEHFDEIKSNDDLKVKVLEIDEAFSNEGIY